MPWTQDDRSSVLRSDGYPLQDHTPRGARLPGGCGASRWRVGSAPAGEAGQGRSSSMNLNMRPKKSRLAGGWEKGCPHSLQSITEPGISAEQLEHVALDIVTTSICERPLRVGKRPILCTTNNNGEQRFQVRRPRTANPVGHDPPDTANASLRSPSARGLAHDGHQYRKDVPSPEGCFVTIGARDGIEGVGPGFRRTRDRAPGREPEATDACPGRLNGEHQCPFPRHGDGPS